MFDNRWDNWAGDFAESFGAGLIDSSVRNFVPDILAQFGAAVRKIDPEFPDDVNPGTFATVMHDTMSRLKLPDAARSHVPEVVAQFFEYLQESGRSGAGDQWADQIRRIRDEPKPRGKPVSEVKGVTIRKSGVTAGRNDPCPCGSGKKYKKCCAGQ